MCFLAYAAAYENSEHLISVTPAIPREFSTNNFRLSEHAQAQLLDCFDFDGCQGARKYSKETKFLEKLLEKFDSIVVPEDAVIKQFLDQRQECTLLKLQEAFPQLL